MKNNYDDEKQTHDLPNRIRNHTSLFVLAVWTLGDHVAPEEEVFKNVDGGDHVYDDHEDDNWIAPDRSHREEFSCLVFLRGDVEEGASADEALVPSEDSFSLVLEFTHIFIFSV